MSTSQKYLFIAIIAGLLSFFYYQQRHHAVEQVTALPAAQALPPAEGPGRTEASDDLESMDETMVSATGYDSTATAVTDDKNHGPGEMNEELRQKVYSEIRVHLSSLYTAEKAYYAEYNRYSSDLKAIGWLPDPGELDIKVGFAETSIAEANEGEDPEGRMDSDYLQEVSVPEATYGYSKWAQGLSLKNLSGQCRNGCRASEHRFEIMAVSRTGPNGAPEVWVINDDKEIMKVTEPSRQ